MLQTLERVTLSLRSAWLALRRRPTFPLVALCILAVGTAFNLAAFSLINTLLFRPLAVPNGPDLVFVFSSDRGRPDFGGHGAFRKLQSHPELFDDVAAMRGDRARMRRNRGVEETKGERVTGRYFEVLGITPQRGRLLNIADEAPDAPSVAVISDALWRSAFDASDSALGQVLTVDVLGKPVSYVIVGVAPAGFGGIDSPWESSQFWLPFLKALENDRAATGFRLSSEEARVKIVVGRPQASTTLEQIQAATSAWEQAEPNPDPRARLRRTVSSHRPVELPFAAPNQLTSGAFAAGLVALAMTVLGIAVANLIGVVRARMIDREPELATRLALGAAPALLVQQMLWEGVLIASGGVAAGLVTSQALLKVLVDRLAQSGALASGITLSIDRYVLLFALLLAVLVGLGIGAGSIPGRVPIARALGGGGGTARGGRPLSRRTKWLVLVPQIALSATILFAAGLLNQQLIARALRPLGYEPERAVYVRLDLPMLGDNVAQLRAEVMTRAVQVVQDLSGLESVAVASALPSQPAPRALIARPGSDISVPAQVVYVSSSFFQVLGLPILSGREFSTLPVEAERLAIVNQALARRLWNDQSPVDQELVLAATVGDRLGGKAPRSVRQVAGVATSVKVPFGTESDIPIVYVPVGAQTSADILLARSRAPGGEAELLKRIEERLKGVGKLELLRSGTVQSTTAAVRSSQGIASVLVSTSGAIGLLLAALGAYGVVAHTAAQRRREIGIRLAIGGEDSAVIRLIVLEGVRIAVISIGLAVCALPATRALLSSYIMPLTSWEFGGVMATGGVLFAVVTLACYLPARRAVRRSTWQAIRD